jgi:transcriptional regulator
LYEPIFHRNEHLPALHALIKARVFGLLISNGPEGLVANSVPFVLDAAA